MQRSATLELLSFACFNHDWTVFFGGIYGSSSSDVVTRMIGFGFLVRGDVGGVTLFEFHWLV